MRKMDNRLTSKGRLSRGPTAGTLQQTEQGRISQQLPVSLEPDPGQLKTHPSEGESPWPFGSAGSRRKDGLVIACPVKLYLDPNQPHYLGPRGPGPKWNVAQLTRSLGLSKFRITYKNENLVPYVFKPMTVYCWYDTAGENDLDFCWVDGFWGPLSAIFFNVVRFLSL